MLVLKNIIERVIIMDFEEGSYKMDNSIFAANPDYIRRSDTEKKNILIEINFRGIGIEYYIRKDFEDLAEKLKYL